MSARRCPNAFGLRESCVRGVLVDESAAGLNEVRASYEPLWSEMQRAFELSGVQALTAKPQAREELLREIFGVFPDAEP